MSKQKTGEQNEQSLQGLWAYNKRSYVSVTGEYWKDKRKRKTNKDFDEIMTEDFPDLAKATDLQTQEHICLKTDPPEGIHVLEIPCP